MLKSVFALAVLLSLTGCSKTGSPASAAPPRKASLPADPDQAMYDSVRSGAYQISTAIDSIEEVRKAVRGIAARETGKTQQTLLQLAGDLDDAGKALADFGDDPPPFDQFKKSFATQDDRRLKAIDAANDSLGDLQDAQEVMSTLLDSHPPEPENTELNRADSDLDDCAQAVEDAITAMGGKVSEE